MKQPTRESFLKDVENHEMKILKDDGLYRHLRFQKPQTSIYFFDIITFPDGLVYRGDMGEFYFERIEDMLCFFRHPKGKLEINIGYWGEKCQAQDVRGGMNEFDSSIWKETIKDYWEEYFEDKIYSEEAKEVWQELETIFHGDDAEWDYVSRVNNFSVSHIETRFNLCDLWESLGSGKRATYRFVWCCYAIAWAVIQYDNSK